MKLSVKSCIPQEMIEEARWLYSLPVKKITPYTSRIFRAVADMKAQRKMKMRPVYPMKKLGEILIEAAGRASVLDEIVRAEKILEVIAVDKKTSTIHTILFRPCRGIRNNPLRESTVAFIEAVDGLQKRHGRKPKRQEIIAALQVDLPAFDDAECTRQIKRVDWGEWV